MNRIEVPLGGVFPARARKGRLCADACCANAQRFFATGDYSVQGPSLPGGELEDSTTGGGEGGVPCRGVVPATAGLQPGEFVAAAGFAERD
jgi:hypothetical protein